MSAPGLGVAAAAPTGTSFVVALVRRFDARTLLVAALVLAVLVPVAGYGLVTPVWDAPWSLRLARGVHTLLTALLMFAFVRIADEAVDRGWRRLPVYALAVIGGAVIGSLVGWEIRAALGLSYELPGVTRASHPAFPLQRRLDVMVICTLVGGLATFIHVNRRTALAARRRQHESERARTVARRQMLESQLQALQARVEPLFLFGTLQRIRQLHRTRPQAAAEMLEDLIDYLRAALPHLRESTSTLGQEATLARAWIDIVRRSSPGLDAAFEITAEARGARLPALVLLPLIQHAVDGGGGPVPSLRIVAALDGDRLRLDLTSSTDAFARAEVADSVPSQIRARLRALHDGRASMRCEALASGSASRVRIVLPLDAVPPGSAAHRP